VGENKAGKEEEKERVDPSLTVFPPNFLPRAIY
jgi:hypothetical protein